MRRATTQLLLSLALPGAAATSQEPETENLVSRIESHLAPFLADKHISGTVLVAQGDKILFERAYGKANHELGVANTIQTRHCIASISKPMTVAIAIRLLEARKLAMTDTLDKWFPDFPSGDKITVEHLLRHRAGIPHRLTRENDEAVPRSAADMVDLAKKATLVGTPGEHRLYSSGGFSVLARVLELASGKPYSELLAEYVCKPAGMKHTLHTNSRTVVAHRAASYMPGAHGLQNAPLKDLSFLVGAGSVYSTARDLFRLMRAVRAGKLGRSVRASLSARWNGATNGFRAFVDHHADHDIIVAVTANLTTGALDRMREDLPRIAAGEEIPVRERVRIEPFKMSRKAMSRYEGVYSLRPGSRMNARVEAGELIVGSYVLIPTGERAFFSIQDYARVTAEIDDQGKVAALMWGAARMRRIGDLDGR